MASLQKCSIVLLDEVSCVINGLTKDHNLYFFEKYGLHAKGYFFHPKYQLGSWDGKIRFFHKTGKTFINLLSEIIPSLIGLKYDVDIDDRRKAQTVKPNPITEDFFAHITNPDTGEPWKVRDYQVECVNSLIKNSGALIRAATGSGKTLICAALALSYERAGNLRSIIIVPDTTLTIQTKEEYEFFGLDVGEYSGSSKDLDHQHVVATWQTLKNNPIVIQQFDMFIIDECLHADTEILLSDGTIKKIIDINIGDLVISYNRKANQFEEDIVLKIHENLIISLNEDMYELEFDNNKTIKITGNHKILTTDGYIRADELTPTHDVIRI